MNSLYLDIFSGISGDMFVGAMLDLGVDFVVFERELKKLGLGQYHLHISRQQRAHIAGTKFDVHIDEHTPTVAHDVDREGYNIVHSDAHSHVQHREHEHFEHHHGPSGHSHHSSTHDHERSHGHGDHHHGRTFADIQKLIIGSGLSDWVKEKSIAVFRRVAEAEGKVHGRSAAEVHFHEVGAVDSIVDIVGACVALELLGKPRVVSAAVVEGTGWVKCAHGRFPVPTPATMEILSARGVAVTQCDEPHELVTPTGAALLAELAETFGPMRGFAPNRIGYGLGTRENKTRPNVLRAVLGAANTGSPAHDWLTDSVAVLQANLDDINAEILGAFVEKALAEGALDIFHTPIQMKKNRPGVLLTVLCTEAEGDRFCELILKETSTFGVRRSIAERRKLLREFRTVTTVHGDVAVKIGKLDGCILQVAPEYESCRKIATDRGVPLKQVYDDTLRSLKL